MEYGFSTDWHKEFPPMVIVSITNLCNQSCVHCYHSKFEQSPEYEATNMGIDLWREICSQIGFQTRQGRKIILNIGCDGEPFLHPSLERMLMIARNHARPGNLAINITTNGTKLNTSMATNIIMHNLVDVLNVSIDAVTNRTYKKIRRWPIAPILRGMNHILEVREKSDSSVKIQVNMIDQPYSHDEVGAFKDYWSGLVDNVMIRTYYDATSILGETGGNITGRQEEFEAIERWPCQQLWRRFNISESGIAHWCVDDWYKKTKIGDVNIGKFDSLSIRSSYSVFAKSISDIWQGEQYQQLRKFHLEGRFAEVPYCAKCTEWQGMKWDYDYFTAMEKMTGRKYV